MFLSRPLFFSASSSGFCILASEFVRLLHRGGGGGRGYRRICSSTRDAAAARSPQVQVLQCQSVDSNTLARLLLNCGKSRALEEGRRVHQHVVRSGLGHSSLLCSHIVHMYLKCGSFQEAEEVFRSMSFESVDVSTWTAVIVATAGLGKWDSVFRYLEEMRNHGVQPDRVLFVALITACTRLGAIIQGRIVQQHLSGTSLQNDVAIGNVLVHMYAKCGCVREAAEVFHKMHYRDIVSWTMMIGAYVQDGQLSVAFRLFRQMQLEGIIPNKVTFVSVLSACETPYALQQGRLIHSQIVDSGLESQVVVANSLLSMYNRCSSLADANRLFEKMVVKDVVSWTTIITASTQQENYKEAIDLYYRMLLEGVMPKTLTFSMVLESCGSLAAFKKGKAVHEQVIERGLECDLVGISLVNMYAKCDSLEDARRVFDKLHNQRSRILWNSMITAYQEKDPNEALQLFRQMQPEAVTPDRITFMSVLNACTKAQDLEQGRVIHERIIDSGFAVDVCVATALFNMYAKCGSLEEAQKVFASMEVRDVISWNNIITAYVQHRHGRLAVNLCRQMQLEGMKPNRSTFTGLLNACADPSSLADGKQIHSWIIESGLQNDVVLGTALITMYANCGSLDDARRLFDGILQNSRHHHRDKILWTSMITAYEQYGEFRKALELYEHMHLREIEPDRVTFISVLNACAHLADIRRGREIHARVIRSGLSDEVGVANSIIFMYGKCGSFDEACVAFEKVKNKSVPLWSSMISAFAQHGHGEQAVRIFRLMRQDGIQLTEVTFIAVLSACSHAGLVEPGCEFFSSVSEHGIVASEQIYSCMVDLLGRAGHLDTAENFISKMPMAPNVVVLTALLGSCKMHGDVERGRRAADKLEALNPESQASYVTLCNIITSK